MVTSTPPASYLSSGVTDLNRQSLWNSMTDEGRAKYSSSTSTSTSTTSGSSTSGSGTSTTGTTTTTTAKPKTFVSMGNATQLSTQAFTGLTDSRSAAPTAETISGFSKLWSGDALLRAQLTSAADPLSTDATPDKGGAIFVTYKLGTVATQTRPYDGKEGNITVSSSLPRSKNPYGYFSTDPAMAETPFVQTFPNGDGSESENAWSAATGKTYSEWAAGARSRYDQYEKLINDQTNSLMANFGSLGDQGLLGYDVNNNGFIDDESELFGFKNGLSIDNANGPTTIKSSSATGTDEQFTFLSNGRLTGDPLDWTQEADRSHYRRFMVLGSDGRSNSLLQSSIGYNSSLNQYVAAQSMLTFDGGTARMTVVSQAGMAVTA